MRLSLVRERLQAFSGREGPADDPVPEGEARAAVALILRPRDESTEILFIRRAEDPRDPWSGHMAFPGGRMDPEDRDAHATAVRETHEEIGLALDQHAVSLGPLPDLPAMARGKRVGLTISPHVFLLERGTPVLAPNHEVAETIWADLAPIAAGELRTSFPYVYEGRSLELPGHKLGERVVWGLTYHMLESFLGIVRK